MKQLQTRLVLMVAILLAISATLLSILALREFGQELPPEMARSVTAVGYSVAAVFDKAYTHGMRKDVIVGANQFFSTIRKENPNIAYLALTDLNGRVVSQDGFSTIGIKLPVIQVSALSQIGKELITSRCGRYFDTSVPLLFAGEVVGVIHLGQSSDLITSKMEEVTLDVITVLVVSGLIAQELLRFVFSFVITTPASALREFIDRVRSGDFSTYMPKDYVGGVGQLGVRLNRIVDVINRRYHTLIDQARSDGKDISGWLSSYRFHMPGQRLMQNTASVDHIRWPFFLLIFADSISLSFFPNFVAKFYSPEMGISKTLVISLPISVFMFTWALSMPWAGSFCDRVGHRKAFILGAIGTTVGLLLTAQSQSLYGLLAWRSVSALGYGLVFVTAQGYISKYSPATQRTRSMAVFLSTFFAGSLCGSAIGGILADRLGDRATITLSAVLSIVAAAFVARFLVNEVMLAKDNRGALTFTNFRVLLLNRKFLAITFLAAVPAKIALTGFLYYSAPLYLKALGNNQSTTGRVMMAYGLAIIILSPFLAKMADKYGRLRWFISVGGFAAAFAMLFVSYFHSTEALLLSITLLGVAHSIGVSPQLPLINDLCRCVVREIGAGTTTGIFRLIERLGNVLGPILAGTLISRFGFSQAFLGMGVLGLLCTSLFTLILLYQEKDEAGYTPLAL